MIISFANSKGGVGKSTTCACLAGALVARGQKVHVIDLDTNRTVNRWLAAPNRPLLTVAAPPTQQLTEHLQRVAATEAPDAILIDLAGTFEEAITIAMARSNLTIIPAAPTEADLYEAKRIANHLQSIFAAFNRQPTYRLLLTKVQSIASHAQAHAFREVERMAFPRFTTTLGHLAAYQEIGFSGAPPHLVTPPRSTTQKAVAEINALACEIADIIGLATPIERKTAA